jgi:hypothetical protein
MAQCPPPRKTDTFKNGDRKTQLPNWILLTRNEKYSEPRFFSLLSWRF